MRTPTAKRTVVGRLTRLGSGQTTCAYGLCRLTSCRVLSLRHRVCQRIYQMVLRVISRPDSLHDLGRRPFQHAKVRVRVQSDPEGPGDQGGEYGDFAPAEVLEDLVFFGNFA